MDEPTALIGGAIITVVSGAVGYLYNALRETKKQKEEEHQKLMEQKEERDQKWYNNRKLAYINFIRVFSTPYSGKMEKYLDSALRAWEFGEITLPKPFTVIERDEVIDLKPSEEILGDILPKTPIKVAGEGLKIQTLGNYIYYIVGYSISEPKEATNADNEITWIEEFDKLRQKAAMTFGLEMIDMLDITRSKP